MYVYVRTYAAKFHLEQTIGSRGANFGRHICMRTKLSSTANLHPNRELLWHSYSMLTIQIECIVRFTRDFSRLKWNYKTVPCTACPMHCISHALHGPCTACPMHCMSHALHVQCTACSMHSMSHALHVPCTACPMHCMSHALHVPCTACPMHCMSHALHVPCTACIYV